MLFGVKIEYFSRFENSGFRLGGARVFLRIKIWLFFKRCEVLFLYKRIFVRFAYFCSLESFILRILLFCEFLRNLGVSLGWALLLCNVGIAEM